MPRTSIIVITGLLTLNGISGLAGGYGLLSDVSGKAVGMSTELLKDSPFLNFLIPGLALFILIGLFSLIAAYMVLRQSKAAPAFCIIEGLMLITWLIVQILSIQQFHILQAIYACIAIALVWAGLSLRNISANPTRIKTA